MIRHRLFQCFGLVQVLSVLNYSPNKERVLVRKMSEILHFRLVSLNAKEGIDLHPGVVTLGRSDENSIAITHQSVSSRHAQLEVNEQGVVVRDLGSTNGTYVNGCQVQAAQLEVGAEIRFGEMIYRLESRLVRITIPEVTFQAEQRAPVFDDGTFACYRHGDVRAEMRCSQCDRTHCSGCIKSLKRKGGQPVLLCPDCSGRCEILPSVVARNAGKGLFGFLSKALKRIAGSE